MNNENTTPLIEVRNLKQYFQINTGFFSSKPLKAVNDISMDTVGDVVVEDGRAVATTWLSVFLSYRPSTRMASRTRGFRAGAVPFMPRPPGSGG